MQIVEGTSFNVPDEKIQDCITSSTSVTPFQDYEPGVQAPSRLIYVKKACLTDNTKDFSLTSGSTYRWRVRALDLPLTARSRATRARTTLNSQWSDPQTTTNGGALPVDPRAVHGQRPDAPAAGDGLVRADLAAVRAANVRRDTAPAVERIERGTFGYVVELALDSSFTTKVAKFWTDSTQIRPNGFLNDNNTSEAYYWSVSACYDSERRESLDRHGVVPSGRRDQLQQDLNSLSCSTRHP